MNESKANILEFNINIQKATNLSAGYFTLFDCGTWAFPSPRNYKILSCRFQPLYTLNLTTSIWNTTFGSVKFQLLDQSLNSFNNTELENISIGSDMNSVNPVKEYTITLPNQDINLDVINVGGVYIYSVGARAFGTINWKDVIFNLKFKAIAL